MKTAGFVALVMVMASMVVPSAMAGDDRDARDQVVGGLINGLLGQPQPSADAVYTAKERDRLVSMLQSGEYATSRQGEPVDAMVYGVPLTRVEHVYSAKPIPPSQVSR